MRIRGGKEFEEFKESTEFKELKEFKVNDLKFLRFFKFLKFFIVFASITAQAQEIVSPLNFPLFLSGNFGELRHNHFHSGIDFKTQGAIGKPVRAVKGGFVSRIGVSPYGYGRAVYIDHPDGTTSVYGHLDHFAPKIESAVRDSQYLKESFSVNLIFSPGEFPLKQGEVFAYSGNTGGSGGPHLHFEFRKTKEEKPIDPLPYFKKQIKDSKSPEVRGIMLFPQVGKGLVNGSPKSQAVELVKDKAGNQSVKTIVKAWGDIGVGIKAYDRMDETANTYGVNEIILNVDGEEVYHSIMDGFLFDHSRCLNSYVDWTEWIERNSFYMKSFTDPGNYLGVNRSERNGVIHIDREKVYHLEYVLKDVYGNKSVFGFTITGVKTAIPALPKTNVSFRYDKDNVYMGKGIHLRVPEKNLYTDLSFNVDTVANYSAYAPLYVIGTRLPLHSYCPITLTISKDTYPDKSKYGVVQVYKNRKTWLGGEYRSGKINTKIRELGSFSIQIDTVPPVITPVNETKWTANKRITFKISDSLSGVSSYRGTLNGKFVLFELDGKSSSLFCVYDSGRMKAGSQTLRLVVKDEAGNQSEFSRQVVF